MAVAKRTFADVAAMEAAMTYGESLSSGWRTVDQATIDAFAEATGDRQWIHVDAARAAAESPFGTTIAHGFLSLSLLSAMIAETFAIDSAVLTINYGFDRVRFIAPVPVDARVRATFALANVTRGGGGTRVTWDVAMEIAGSAKPALAAQWIALVVEGG